MNKKCDDKNFIYKCVKCRNSGLDLFRRGSDIDYI